MYIEITETELAWLVQQKRPEKVPVELDLVKENALRIVVDIKLFKLTITLSNPSMNKEGWLRFDVSPADIGSFMKLLMKAKPELRDRIRSKPGRLAVKMPEELLDRVAIKEIRFEEGRVTVEAGLMKV
ncbi:hypothetical protein GF324_09895 [bacterium]|nr:hypothetical protein [bacterium]